MDEFQEPCEHPGLPLDVVQIVLGYVNDTRSMAAARQVCAAWHSASSAATATVSAPLPGSIPEMRSKLALLLHVMPSLAGCHLSVSSGAATAYPAECCRQLLSFPALKVLELKFTDSLILTSDDITHMACLTALTCLHLHNVSLPAATDSSPLLQLQGLNELSLVHHSKVSALLVGDSHLEVMGRLTGLTHLVLQGRMCSASDSGLLALSGLTRLNSLAISWVPWQSQITQAAALQLLSGLKSLKALQLGGAELLLPSVPQFPVAAVHAPPAPPAAVVAAAGSNTPALTPALSGALSLTTSTTGGQTDLIRSLLLAQACGLEEFKLQFNCCGTGVEKALLALGDVSGKLTAMQWSYAKLSGPSSTTLLAACTSLTSLKLRLWYQDYNLAPFTFKLTQLTTLTNLRSLVIDKRPPFQQQLPVQQNAISIPLTPAVLQRLTAAWRQLQKLQLGLSRADFGSAPLQGLAGFTQLKSLSVHCYDQGYDDGQFMLPVDITCLPSSLVKIDLMHAELFSSGESISSTACKAHSGAPGTHSGGQSRQGSITDSSSSSSGSNSNLRSCCSGCCAADISSRGNCCSSGSSSGSMKAPGKVDFATASAHTFASMLSESFSVLSRQASVEHNAAAYLLPGWQDNNQLLPNNIPQQQPQVQAYYAQYQPVLAQQQQLPGVQQVAGASLGHMLPALSAFASAQGAAAAAAVAAAAATADGSSSRLVVSNSATGIPLCSSNSWLHDLMHSLPTIPAANSTSSSSSSSGSGSDFMMPAAVQDPAVSRTGSSTIGLSRQQSLPPLHEQKVVLPAGQRVGLDAQHFVPVAPDPTAHTVVTTRRNPFAAASAAAAVQAAISGCVAAAMDAEVLTPDSDKDCSRACSKDQDSLCRSHSLLSRCSSSSKSGSRLVGSLSVMQAVFKGAGSKSAAANDQVQVQRAHLPHLQQLQLKHCSLVGVCLEDVVSRPQELRVLQLIEVLGLSPRDIALLPYLNSVHRLTLIAAREDAWLGLAPLRPLARLQELRHLDWVVSDKALSGRHSRAPELQALATYPKLQVLTVHTLLGRCEQLHAISGQLRSGCAVRLMTPAFCEHATKKSGIGIGKLLGVASCLLPGTVPVM